MLQMNDSTVSVLQYRKCRAVLLRVCGTVDLLQYCEKMEVSKE